MLPYTDLQIRTNMKLYGNDIFSDKIFYHIYPLGMGNCPKENNFTQSAGNFLKSLKQTWIESGDLAATPFTSVQFLNQQDMATIH